MKKSQIGLLTFSTILLLSTTVQAALTIQEYVPGEKVVLDTVTGHHWYWNLPDFADMTYAQQKTAIAGLGQYGGLLGGWHMATRTEMDAIWTYTATELIDSFKDASTGANLEVYEGRYDEEASPGYHYRTNLYRQNATGYVDKKPLGLLPTDDTVALPFTPAWVTTASAPASAVIPAPSALVMSVIGVSSLMAAHRRRRRQ